jgi:hypothetical protein
VGTNKISSVLLITAAVLLSVPLSPAGAKPTTPGQAMVVVQAWCRMEAAPLKSSLGKAVSEVQTFRDTSGTDLYHVVYLSPAGFAIVPADDLVEPIIAFSSEGNYDASETNPLGALVGNDLPGRIARVRGSKQFVGEKSGELTSEQATALRKWERLQNSAPLMESGFVTVSDLRVAPLILSKWDQATVNDNYCYNYYTPNHYRSGCVATAMSQLMRFHQTPGSAVGTGSFTIYVDGVNRSEALMGGNGTGGAYSWADMPLLPDETITDAQRQAIGRMLHDTGASVNMNYTSNGSFAPTWQTADALKTTFGYSNAVVGGNNGYNIPADARNRMVNPNLDAGLPVLFGIVGSHGGHAIVGDGYGYQSGTMYHHLNMGWSGNNDLWYNLPNIDDSYYGFTSILDVVYNVYTSGTGEIISGRIVGCAGGALSGVTVTATLYGGATMASTTTNSNGIYAFTRLSSDTSYIIGASKSGFSFEYQQVNTGNSWVYPSSSGNRWGVDFSDMQGCRTLTVTIAGNGGGSVTSDPAGISCATASCSAPFPYGSNVSLLQAPNAISTFGNWGGDCLGTGDCSVTMDTARTVSANFTLAPKAKIGTSTYTSLNAAYADATNGATILALDADLDEVLNMNNPAAIAIILDGGYKADYSGKSGYPTILKGPLTIATGSLNVKGPIALK